MAKKKQSTVSAKDFTDALISDINSKFKTSTGKTAYYLSDPNVASDVKTWVGTGCTPLDLAISNRPHGGFPAGRIIEITGLEASGKSLLAAHALASTQKKGGVAVYIDTEAAADRTFLKAIGVDDTKLLYIPLECLEDIFEAIEALIDKVRSANKDILMTIVVDSVMGSTTKSEVSADYEREGWATDKAIIISKAMRKVTNLIAREQICLIFTNQLRAKLGVSFGDPYSTSGGKALAFHASVRLRLKQMGQIKLKVNGQDTVVGIKTRAVVQKNRLGPPLRSVDYDIYFDSGIDDYGSWLTTLKKFNLVSTGGAWYTLKLDEKMDIVKPNTGEVDNTDEVKFMSKDFASLMEHNETLRDQVYEKICESSIMQYKINQDYGIDDIEIEEEFLPEEA